MTSRASRTSGCSRCSTAGRSRRGSRSAKAAARRRCATSASSHRCSTSSRCPALRGELAIGHNRYSTTGANAWANAQPIVHHGKARTVALGHNGNLVNAEALRLELGKPLRSTSDSELIAVLIADDESPLDEALTAAMARLEGAATVVGLTESALFAFRDPHGFRPLSLGWLGDDPVVASESCALELVGARFEREIAPGRAR